MITLALLFFQTDSITLYQHAKFHGRQIFLRYSDPWIGHQLNDEVTSYIITGTSDWKIYE